MKHFLLLFVLFAFLMTPVYAQVSMNDLVAPNKKKTCADTVSIAELVENSDLAFTGRVIDRSANFTWFRIYVVHHGKPESKIIKTAGYFARDKFYADGGQSYEPGEVYSVIVHRPQTKAEKNLGVDYINSLDKCEEGVVSKMHDRYGNYRVKPEQLEPGTLEKAGNHWFHNKLFYLSVMTLVMLGAFYLRFKITILSLIARLQKPA